MAEKKSKLSAAETRQAAIKKQERALAAAKRMKAKAEYDEMRAWYILFGECTNEKIDWDTALKFLDFQFAPGTPGEEIMSVRECIRVMFTLFSESQQENLVPAEKEQDPSAPA